MAGNYPDVPGVRMAYDVDGTQGYYGTSSAVTALTGAQLIGLNGEAAPTGFDGGASGSFVGLFFPELRDIVGYFAFVTVGSGAAGPVQTSVDTTNMMDGTWVQLAAGGWGNAALNPNYRSQIITGSASAVKAIRFTKVTSGTYQTKTLHVYGNMSSGQNPDRVRFWHPTIDQALSVTPAFLDWGSAVRATTSTKQFRIKNNSATLTAHSIAISTEILTDASPTRVGEYQFSFASSAFQNAINIGDLAPGAISGLITVQRSTIVTAALGVWSARFAAIAGSMS